MALDTTGNWVAGDDLRVIEALRLPFGSYTLKCTQDCMNQLEDMSPEAVLAVRDLLTEYETAKTAESTSNLADTEGKTLVKADVLEWERNGASQASGPQQEMSRIQMDLKNYMAFCSCLGGVLGGYSYTTPLIRS
ncbi:MAG: hypothetical protein ACO3HF_01010 [Burkholderiaceae bacterium]